MILLASAFAAAAVATAPPASSCPGKLAALREAADAIDRRYVIASTGRSMANNLRRRIASGAYGDVCSDDAAFIARVNRDLDVYDGHFHFERPKAEGSGQDDWLMAWRKGSREANAGVRDVRVLDGNVGYLRISSFYPWDLARPKMTAAFALLAETDALVLDLRQNGGGDAETAGQIVRALLGDQAHAVQEIDRRGDRTREPLPIAELPPVPARRPVAVLLDRRSASASEFVAYALQAAGRAAIVGDRSAGAAHMFGDPVALPGGYALTIPDARPINLQTGANWEGSGVKPDVPGGDDPQYRARRHLETLASRAP